MKLYVVEHVIDNEGASIHAIYDNEESAVNHIVSKHGNKPNDTYIYTHVGKMHNMRVIYFPYKGMKDYYDYMTVTEWEMNQEKWSCKE